MSLLFADIYDGIRAIRITKGVSEKDILNFVQEKVGGCMNVGNVLKTIRTLKKLCEDGVLMKKGKRYMFTPKNCRKEEEEEEDEEEDDECQEEIQPQVADSCDECDDGAEEKQDNQEEEEEEDDDDEEEDDDDDDDDDDEECDEKDVQAAGEEGSGKKENTMEMNRNPIRSKESLIQGGPSSKSPTSGNGSSENGNGTPSCFDKKVNRAMTGDSVKKAGSDKGRKTCKGKSIVEQDSRDATGTGNEAIAFCVRDFIDSLSQPDSEALEFGREISLKKRGLRNKRNAGRSRSPVKEGQAELFHCLGKGPSDEIGFRAICSDLFQDPADVEMEVDQKKEEEVTTIHRSLPIASGEPCGDPDKMQSVLAERSYDDFRETLAKKASMILPVQNNECALGQMTWYPLEEREKETETANRSSSDEGNGKEKTVSLCSVCEKKKRNL